MPSKTNSQTLLYRSIDRLIGKENLEQVREDFKWIAFNSTEKFQRWNSTSQDLKKEALDAKDRARRSRWDQIGFFFGVVLSIFSLLGLVPFETLLILVGVAISVLAALRRVTVTMLIYDNPYRIYDDQELKFACAWNQAMDGWTSMLVMPLGLLNKVVPEKYKLGLWDLEEAVKRKYK